MALMGRGTMNVYTGGIITMNHSGQARSVLWNSLRGEILFKKIECSDSGCLELETLYSQVRQQ